MQTNNQYLIIKSLFMFICNLSPKTKPKLQMFPKWEKCQCKELLEIRVLSSVWGTRAPVGVTPAPCQEHPALGLLQLS